MGVTPSSVELVADIRQRIHDRSAIAYDDISRLCDDLVDLRKRIERVVAICGDADTGWPAMVSKMLREEPAQNAPEESRG